MFCLFETTIPCSPDPGTRVTKKKTKQKKISDLLFTNLQFKLHRILFVFLGFFQRNSLVLVCFHCFSINRRTSHMYREYKQRPINSLWTKSNNRLLFVDVHSKTVKKSPYGGRYRRRSTKRRSTKFAVVRRRHTSEY